MAPSGDGPDRPTLRVPRHTSRECKRRAGEGLVRPVGQSRKIGRSVSSVTAGTSSIGFSHASFMRMSALGGYDIPSIRTWLEPTNEGVPMRTPEVWPVDRALPGPRPVQSALRTRRTQFEHKTCLLGCAT